MSGDNHFIRPDNDPEPTAVDFAALADEYQHGLDKMIASGYEEFGSYSQRRHGMVITALRAYASDQNAYSEAFALLDGHLGDSLISRIKRVLDLSELRRKQLESVAIR